MSLRYRNILHSLKKYLPETQAVIDRAVLEGFTLPSTATLSYINTLISVMIADGYWAKRDLILNFAYNDLNCEDFSRINWKNPTGDLALKVGVPIYQIDGWKGTGSTLDFINTQYNLLSSSVQYTLNNASREAILTHPGTTTSFIDGSSSGFGEGMRAGNFSTQRINCTNNSLSSAVNLSGLGYTAINRTSSTNVELFKKEVQSSRTQTSTSLINAPQRILYGAFLSTLVCVGYYSIGSEVVAEGQLLRTAYNNYLTNIGLSPIA
jgi:hypothetical protein